MQVVDYSFARPGAAAIRNAGHQGAVRYLSPAPVKNINRAERDELRQAGLWIGFVWEDNSTRASEGFDAGVADARQANAMADELEVPGDVALYYAVDRPDTTPAMTREYFKGILSVGGRPAGVYGSETVCEAMLDLGCKYAWQVETWGNRISPRVHLVQLVNTHSVVGSTDLNDVKNDDWGGWPPPGHPVLSDLPSEFSYITNGEDWLWLGGERIHTRCGSVPVLQGLTAGRQIVQLGPKSDEFHQFLTSVANNARFTS